MSFCSAPLRPASASRRLRLRPFSTLLLAACSCTLALAQGVPELRLTEFFKPARSPAGLEMSASLLAAQDQTVRLVGYMVQQERAHPGRFMLSPRPVQMSEHADGDADDLPASVVTVYLDDSQHDWVVPFARGLIGITGQLRLGRLEETDGRVSWVRLRLPPQATRRMDSAEIANHQQALEHKH